MIIYDIAVAEIPVPVLIRVAVEGRRIRHQEAVVGRVGNTVAVRVRTGARARGTERDEQASEDRSDPGQPHPDLLRPALTARERAPPRTTDPTTIHAVKVCIISSAPRKESPFLKYHCARNVLSLDRLKNHIIPRLTIFSACSRMDSVENAFRSRDKPLPLQIPPDGQPEGSPMVSRREGREPARDTRPAQRPESTHRIPERPASPQTLIPRAWQMSG